MSSELLKSIHVMPEDYPLKNADCVTYVLCEDLENPDNELGIMLYAGSDCSLEHIRLLELAKECELVDEDAEALGGGHLYADTRDKKRDSYLFGGVDRAILEMFVDYLENIQDV